MTKITVGFLVFPGFQLLDVAGPTDAFAEVAQLSAGDLCYDMVILGTRRSGIRSSSGLEVHPDYTIYDTHPTVDTLIVPGGLGVFDAMEEEGLCQWLRVQQTLCRRHAAICNGIFAYAAAGLINGRLVTTHWMDATHLQTRFSQARVEADRIYCKDGSLYSTAGVTAGIDLALLLIEEDYGSEIALGVAKFLIVYLRRPGGQSQFSPLLEMQSNADSVSHNIQQYILNNLELDHSLVSLAQWAATSERSLSRLFKRETGKTVKGFLSSARIDAARRLLETSDMPTKQIASKCGFRSVDALAKRFNKALDVTPVEYRRRFRRM